MVGMGKYGRPRGHSSRRRDEVRLLEELDERVDRSIREDRITGDDEIVDGILEHAARMLEAGAVRYYARVPSTKGNRSRAANYHAAADRIRSAKKGISP